jgi:CHAT domain-containing protein
MKNVLRFLSLLLLCVVANAVYSHDIDTEIQQISSFLTSGNTKECRDACLRILKTDECLDNHGRLSIEIALATSDFILGYTDEGMRYLTMAENKLNDVLEPSCEEYVQWMIAFSALYNHVDGAKSHTLLKKAIETCEDHGLTKTQSYVQALLRLCGIYNKMEMDYSTAVDEILHRVLPLSQQVCGSESIEYSLSLMEAIKNAERKGYIQEQFRYTEAFISNPNLFADNDQIRDFVNRHRLYALIALKNYQQAIQEATVYSAELRKRCLDNYSKYTSNERWNMMLYVQSWFLDEYPRLLETNPSEEVISSICDGILFAKGLMLSLDALQSKGEDYFTHVNWKNIEKHLNLGEAAIEFYCISNNKGLFYQYNYKAIVIKKGFSTPLLVDIGEWSGSNEDYEAIASFCWKSLMGVLRDVKQLYFSPHGILHTTPIESFLPLELRNMKVCRISSTRQIVNRQESRGDGAALFGGLTYNMDIEEMKSFALKRGAECMLNYLPGTKTEIDEVGKFLRQRTEGKIAIYSGRYGTEESFKALSKKHTRVIHIATHGFYFRNTKNTANKDEFDDFSATILQLEDKPLTRSGLFLAGAENSLLGEGIPMCIEDGVLTAQEISQLILDGTELIVLSACETALGDITGDGVFGLQRGFKKAGVQSILMSLWKVDDEATCLLMTEFYKKWIGEKKSKREALEQAKLSVRSHKEKGWDDPKYWAAFILLDALD